MIIQLVIIIGLLYYVNLHYRKYLVYKRFFKIWTEENVFELHEAPHQRTHRRLIVNLFKHQEIIDSFYRLRPNIPIRIKTSLGDEVIFSRNMHSLYEEISIKVNKVNISLLDPIARKYFLNIDYRYLINESFREML